MRLEGVAWLPAARHRCDRLARTPQLRARTAVWAAVLGQPVSGRLAASADFAVAGGRQTVTARATLDDGVLRATLPLASV